MRLIGIVNRCQGEPEPVVAVDDAVLALPLFGNATADRPANHAANQPGRAGLCDDVVQRYGALTRLRSSGQGSVEPMGPTFDLPVGSAAEGEHQHRAVDGMQFDGGGSAVQRPGCVSIDASAERAAETRLTSATVQAATAHWVFIATLGPDSRVDRSVEPFVPGG